MGGISASTSGNTLYGTDGYVTANAIDLGATVGDFQVEWGTEHYYPDFSQARGPISGTGKVTGGFFRIKVTLAEFGWTNLSGILAELGADSSGNSYKFGAGTLDDPVEISSIILTGIEKKSGKAVKVTIPTAYVEVDSLAFSKGQETTLPVTFHGLFTTTDPTKLPGYIEIQK